MLTSDCVESGAIATLMCRCWCCRRRWCRRMPSRECCSHQSRWMQPCARPAVWRVDRLPPHTCCGRWRWRWCRQTASRECRSHQSTSTQALLTDGSVESGSAAATCVGAAGGGDGVNGRRVESAAAVTAVRRRPCSPTAVWRVDRLPPHVSVLQAVAVVSMAASREWHCQQSSWTCAMLTSDSVESGSVVTHVCRCWCCRRWW